ncbi:protein phosphatase 2C [Echinococcus multilocularis]|uniref:Protein phosphatase 2C n=1 Tax=Echinococcus multilocularis TaxID=6211 RepID=A0A0S4MM91_ECHMU|nr:protein phosphatase 2C [Echinococcus multilocularis]
MGKWNHPKKVTGVVVWCDKAPAVIHCPAPYLWEDLITTLWVTKHLQTNALGLSPQNECAAGVSACRGRNLTKCNRHILRRWKFFSSCNIQLSHPLKKQSVLQCSCPPEVYAANIAKSLDNP